MRKFVQRKLALTNIQTKTIYIIIILIILTVAQIMIYTCDNTTLHKNENKRRNCTSSENINKDVIKSSVVERIKQLTKCENKLQNPSIEQHGKFWIFYNFARSKLQFGCSETITCTTNGDFSFLDNLEPLVSRWKGPISIALYAPGDDYVRTIDSIRYLRQCGPEIIQNLVTFHIYFDRDNMPERVLGEEYLNSTYYCEIKPPYMVINTTQMYKYINNVTYPINVARNIARKAAQTHFIFSSDIELYPSKDIIPRFLEMIVRNESLISREGLKVFVLSVFEVEANETVPETKTQLQLLLHENKSIPFHKRVCVSCHNVPASKEWQESQEGDQLNVFYIGKRILQHSHWEPFYIGTNNEPFFDERLTWDGKNNKMIQAYIMCLLDYDFMILDNAFLVHKPGIKVYKRDSRRINFITNSNLFIKNKIHPQLKLLYGEREGCSI